MTTDELKKLAEAATPGPWVMWTSCSWRRLKNSEGVGVCVPFVNMADKHPDMEVSIEDSAFMEAANPAAILKLLAINAELVEEIKNAKGMIQAMKEVIDKDDARWKFLHTPHQDDQGFEWCVMRVKWDNGQISEALHTYANLSDMDTEIARQAALAKAEGGEL